MNDSTDGLPGAGNAAPTVGQRRIFYFNDTGQPAYRIYDLTTDDFLNPQPGDEFFNGELHDQTARILASMLHHHFRYSPTSSVHIRPKVIWPDRTLDQPMPDVAIVSHLNEPQRQRPILDLAAEQNTPSVEDAVTVRAIFEVTSPLLATQDRESKRTLYARAGVAEYWILDTGLRPGNNQPHFTLLGYQLQAGHYEPITQNDEGRWHSKVCRLWLATDENHQRVQLWDVRTGNALPLPDADDNPAISAQAEANRRAQSISDQLNL